MSNDCGRSAGAWVAAGQYARTTATTSAASTRNADAFANLGRNPNGTAGRTDEDVPHPCWRGEECDVLAAVTQLDNTNLMCAEVANYLFGVPHVISRLYNLDHERAYMQLGIDYVCGTSLVAEDVFSKTAVRPRLPH